MIKVESLTKNFETVKAIDNLTCEFPSGVTGLVGQNGAGKSTLLRVIAGIYHADGGTSSVDGYFSDTQEGRAKVFFLPDDPYVPSGSNVKQAFAFYDALFDIDKDKFYQILSIFGLPTDRNVTTFSKGMKRQLFVALALAMKVDNLLLDEAFDGLDPLVVDAIKEEIIKEASEGKTIVISSHNILALQRLADRFVILNKGKVAKEGENEDIGQEFVKYQAAFTFPVNEENIAKLGYRVVSFRSIGSVTHFVIYGEEGAEAKISEALKPLFIEKVPLEPDEVVALEMMAARKGGEDHA